MKISENTYNAIKIGFPIAMLCMSVSFITWTLTKYPPSIDKPTVIPKKTTILVKPKPTIDSVKLLYTKMIKSAFCVGWRTGAHKMINEINNDTYSPRRIEKEYAADSAYYCGVINLTFKL